MKISTSQFIFLAFLALALLSLVAGALNPGKDTGGRTALTWVSDGHASRTDQITAFNLDNPEALLSLDYGNTGSDKIMLQCISGVGPELFDIYDREQLQAYVESGILLDISQQAKRMGFSAQGNTWPEVRDLLCYEGKQYAYPANVGASILIYNKNVFDAFGVEYPQGIMNWDEFFEFASQVNSQTSNNPSAPKDVFAIRGLNWRIFFEGMRGEFFGDDGRLRIADSPELLRAFQMYHDILFKYRLSPSSVEMASMSGRGGYGGAVFGNFAAGKFAMMVSGHFSIPFFEQAHAMQVKELSAHKEHAFANAQPRPLRIGGTLLPHFAGSAPSYRLQARMTGINAKSRKVDESLKFLQFLSGPHYSEIVNRYSDALPGNPEYADLGLKDGTADIPRREMHQTTVTAVSYGYMPRTSPFIMTSDVTRVLDGQINRMENDPQLEPQYLLKEAQAELEKKLARNLSLNPELKKLYDRTGER